MSRYFLVPLKVFDNDHEMAALSSAMVSPTTIFRVLEDSATARKMFLQRRILKVTLDQGGELHGRLIREVGRDGIHYNLRLIESIHQSRAIVGEFQEGFSAPWKRQFPRIPIAPILETIEVPALVHFPRITRETIGYVVNFSYHGMFFEFQCSGLSITEQVDQTLKFKIVTSSRIALCNIEAQIVHIYDEALERGKIVRGLGLKFIYMRKEVRRKYDDMILEVCQGLKKEI